VTDLGPNQDLADPKKERFARARALGLGPSAAYSANIAAPGTTKASIKSAAHLFERRPEVAERIAFLRRQYSDRIESAPEINATTLRDLMEEALRCLTDVHDVAELTGLASESDLSKLRQKITTTVGKMRRATTPVRDQKVRSFAVDTDALLWCLCEKELQ